MSLLITCKKKFEDTKGIIRSHKSKDRQYNSKKSEDAKGVIRSHKSKDRQYNGQKKNNMWIINISGQS
jgi:hypothetical protein